MNTKSLTRVTVQGFRSIRDIDLADIGRATVLIGPNGAGKSNLLSLLRLAPLLRTRSLRRFVAENGGAAGLLYKNPKVTPQARIRLEFHQETGDNAYEAVLAYTSGDNLIFLEELVAFRATADQPWKTFSLGSGHSESRLEDAQEQGHTEKTVRWWLSRMSFYHFHDTSHHASLRGQSRVDDTRFLRSDGSNLAAFLLRLRDSGLPTDGQAWRRINTLLRRVAPYIQELNPTRYGETSVRLDWIDDQGDAQGPHQLADGTLRLIALITALGQPPELLPAFICIDEPELGLHPAAITLVGRMLRAASTHCQLMVATESPVLLDEFDETQILITERLDGATTFTRPTADDLEVWLDEYEMGETPSRGGRSE